jgi:hypothetical protein
MNALPGMRGVAPNRSKSFAHVTVMSAMLILPFV